MKYRNIDGQLEVTESVTVKYDIRDLKERKKIIEQEINQLLAEKEKVQKLIDQAKMLNIE